MACRTVEELDQRYRRLILCRMRTRGVRGTDLEDCLQTFYCRCLEWDTLGKYDPSRGEFTTYIISCVDNSLNRETRSVYKESDVLVRVGEDEGEVLEGRSVPDAEKMVDLARVLEVLKDAPRLHLIATMAVEGRTMDETAAAMKVTRARISQIKREIVYLVDLDRARRLSGGHPVIESFFQGKSRGLSDVRSAGDMGLCREDVPRIKSFVRKVLAEGDWG